MFRASAADLFRYGLTSNQVWILLAFIGGPAANWVGDRVERWIEWLTESGVISAGQLASAPWLAALAVLGLLAGFALLLMLALSVFLMVPVASAFTGIFLDDVTDAVETEMTRE